MSHDYSSLSSTSFSRITFQNFPGISDLFSEVSKLQHRTNPYSKCSAFQVSMVASIKIMQFGGLMQCNLVERYHGLGVA